MKYCDLHNHSSISDGTYTPRELVEYACEKGLSAIGLTDHNNVEGLEEFEKSAQELGIEYVFGAELTTDYQGKEIHLLALFITRKNANRIESFTKKQLASKDVSNRELEVRLKNGGYDISLDELKAKYGANINRAHFAKELVLKGYYKTTDDAFDTVLKTGNGFYIPPSRLDFLQGGALVREWGCVPVMAHPLLSVNKNELEQLLPVAKEKGLVGIEVYYPKFSQEEQNYLHSLAEKHGMLLSGGSDFHGSMKSSGDLGDACVPYDCYKKLDNFYKTIDK